MMPFRRNYQSIPQHEDDVEAFEQPKRTRWQAIVGVTVAILGTVALIAYTASSSETTVSQPTSLSATTGLSLKVYNPNYKSLASRKYLPWQYIAEAHRENAIEIVAIKGYSASDLDATSVTWTIDGVEAKGLAGVTSGTHKFGAVGWRVVTVTATTSSGVSVTGSAAVMVKYVRREVRTLTDDDRTAMFAAMKAVYKIPTEEGQKLYGAKFKNIEHFVTEHLKGAGTIECDHWHDGAGLMTHHVGFTLEFEQAMQAYDPSVSLAYWEYGKDSTLTDFGESVVFSSEYYGQLNPTNDEHTVSEGTWAYTPVLDGSKYTDLDSEWGSSVNPMTNAFGQLRTPWNNNPSPYVSRHNSTMGVNKYVIPGCGPFEACYEEDSIAEMNNCLNGETHGPVHILIGGSWGREEYFNELPDAFQSMWKGNGPLYFKLLWRTGFTRCPTSCDIDDPDSCACSIPQKYFDKFTPLQILDASGLGDYAPATVTGTNAYLFLKAVEDAGHVGDMYTSAAPYDPTFWPLHGAADRLLGRKRIMKSLGVIEFNETWGYADSSAPFLSGYCDWSAVEDDEDFPVCDYDTECYGHGEDDLLEFENLIGTGQMTNAEFYAAMHPWNEELPYVYDSFDYEFCEEDGYTFR